MKIYVNEKYLNTSKIGKCFRIANLTATHFRGDKYAKDIKDAIKRIEEINPDMVALTGDFIDSLEYGINYKKEIKNYLSYLASICPTIMSFGSHDLELFLNHKKRDQLAEDRRKYQEEYFEFLKDIDKNFYPICPESVERLDLDNNISIFGYSYPDVEGPDVEKINGNIDHMKKYLNAMDIDKQRYNILLCHAPLGFFDRGVFTNDCGDFDLILSGHNHAGMMPRFLRFLPFGIIGPDRTILPKHVSGLYENSSGNSIAISSGFLKVPGIVIEDFPFIGNIMYLGNNIYAREMDEIIINDEVRKIKKMG